MPGSNITYINVVATVTMSEKYIDQNNILFKFALNKRLSSKG
jgi:hypothetical protein